MFLAFGYIGLVPRRNEVFIPYLLLLLYIFISELYMKKKNPVHNWAYSMMSQIYIALPFSLLNILAYYSLDGQTVSGYTPILPLSIFIFNWVNDTGAYCTGMLFGKHRLFERISPKKSWEGFWGGMFFCVMTGVGYYYLIPEVPATINSLPFFIILGIIVSVFATFGDLVESMFKRSVGVKDSGNLIPGH